MIKIDAQNVDFHYGDFHALKNISMQIEANTSVAFIGPSGCGKSTFLRLFNRMNDLIPDTRLEGKIFIDGRDIYSKGEKVDTLRKNVGMVFQNPDNQLVATIVEDDVAFGPENLGIPPEEIRRRVDDALRDVGMSEYAKHEPHRLSGGQKQRVAIAGILAMMPECIIFDESTAMLDPVGRREVMDAIVRLNREKGITVIMITHYMDEAAMADRILVLNDGEKLIEGTPAEVFEQEKLLKSCGLDVPQGTELIHRLREAGILLDGECVTVEQCAGLIAGKFR